MSRVIVVPMKDPSVAKSRLAGVMSPSDRTHLVQTLFLRMANALTQVRAPSAVLTSSAQIAECAMRSGLMVIEEHAPQGLNIAAKRASNWAKIRGYTRLCLLPGDLAAPKVCDIQDFLETQADVAVCPSQDGGTNALLVPPGASIFAYGRNSAQRHLTLAREAGYHAVLRPMRSLHFDIDTAEDVHAARKARPELQVV